MKFLKINGTKKKKWVHLISLPCQYRGRYNLDQFKENEIGSLYAEEVDELIKNVKQSGRQIAAFIHESMISCGGQIVLPQNYLQKVYRQVRSKYRVRRLNGLRDRSGLKMKFANRKWIAFNFFDCLIYNRIVRDAGGVCIADEVQVGFGRTGKMWAFEHQNVVPDIVTMGKPMGNGHPLACVVTTPEIAECFAKIGTEYFNTYGGNPVSLAVGNAVLDVIESENLIQNATEIGQILLNELNRLKEKYQIIGDVRGLGYFIGVDLVMNRRSKKPATTIAEYVVARFKENRILMSTEGKFGNVLKFKPPMLFDRQNVQQFIKVFDEILQEIHCCTQLSRSSSVSSAYSSDSCGPDLISSDSLSDEETVFYDCGGRSFQQQL
ncbi:hypothetical protein SSS_10662 [Sarcoptes scabiei]|nr:hypothetical protein SSS_10662 [Sarcoptes scabiei]